MKTKSKINGYIIRSAAYAAFLSLGFIGASSAFQWPNKWYKSLVATVGYGSTAKSPSQPRALSFAERVVYQRAIENVYWRHRIWPNDNADPKPSLDAVTSQAQLENKVGGYLHDSLVLEDYWQKPITAEQLQAEMNRMAQHTKQPEVLQELFETLGNDPAVIAECLARPILAERLMADLSAHDQDSYAESPGNNSLAAGSLKTRLRQVVYSLPKIAEAADLPCTDDTWTVTSALHAPTSRSGHTAVWTGSEMIVWGDLTDTGGRYNPSTDSWTATSTTNAPSGRLQHTAIWTGSEMIIWGGRNEVGILNTGWRYNPVTNSWTAITTINAPAVRFGHTAVWTGSEMIVWGGETPSGPIGFNNGGRYNPSTDRWTATSTTGAPAARRSHTAIWSGSEMIVWGGYNGRYLNTGGRYNPSTDTWTATTPSNAPTGRSNHTAVWTGNEMIVWGRGGNTGGRYNPSTDRWTDTSTINAPADRFYDTAVWTGSEMIVWGGYNYTTDFNTGGRYNPTTDIWTATSTTNAPSARYWHTAVWTGSEMIVWGGANDTGYFNTGARYCAQPPPPLTIIEPNGGEVWLMGSVHEIKWDANLKDSDRLIIQYSRTGGATGFRIAQDVPALSHSYSWRVDNYPTTEGRVKILLQGHREITDQSDANFTVQKRPYITLHRPNGGEVFTIGQYLNIHWSRQNPGGNTVDIDYSIDNGATWIRIATQAEDTGWYFWNIPAPATTTAKVRIRFHETPSVNDTSEAVFTIIE